MLTTNPCRLLKVQSHTDELGVLSFDKHFVTDCLVTSNVFPSVQCDAPLDDPVT